MSKLPQQQPSKKWVGPRAIARAEDNALRKVNTGGPPAAPATHEQQPLQVSSPQLPQSLFFERQEAVDALSNLYHNTDSPKTIETGAAVVQPRDSVKFHEELAEALKSGGYL